MKTIGQTAYERHNRRNAEAPDWVLLPPGERRHWENTAAAVIEFATADGSRA